VGAKDFYPNFPKLVQKVVVQLLPIVFWCDLKKMVFACFSANDGRHFLKSHKVGGHFAQIFMDFSLIFRDFVRIFRDFARIFIKSKILGIRLHPLAPPSPTPLPTVVA